MNNRKEEADQTGCNPSHQDSNPCPICLAPLVDESYLDSCFHKFCYNCIVRWSRVVASKSSGRSASVKCPLCKRENFSIISGFDGTCFQRHYVDQDFGNRFTFSKAHKYRLQCYYSEPGILNDIFDVSRFWKSRKYLQSNRWLRNWLKRELQALMQEEDVDIVVHHIHGVIESFWRRIEETLGLKKNAEARQENFRIAVSDAAQPFLLARTDRFVNELELFLASGLNIEAYDAVYMQRLGWNTSGLGWYKQHSSSYLFYNLGKDYIVVHLIKLQGSRSRPQLDLSKAAIQGNSEERDPTVLLPNQSDDIFHLVLDIGVKGTDSHHWNSEASANENAVSKATGGGAFKFAVDKEDEMDCLVLSCGRSKFLAKGSDVSMIKAIFFLFLLSFM
ncbi:hypothetical protein V6N11_050430 [Hibiscus sabdariffa]|uniref:RING-type domain-containing protein n=1 Tax=Hibiscus sabdariffa TaxID=183260 RepID=A0ABR2T9V4_9ROSI